MCLSVGQLQMNNFRKANHHMKGPRVISPSDQISSQQHGVLIKFSVIFKALKWMCLILWDEYSPSPW